MSTAAAARPPGGSGRRSIPAGAESRSRLAEVSGVEAVVGAGRRDGSAVAGRLDPGYRRATSRSSGEISAPTGEVA